MINIWVSVPDPDIDEKINEIVELKKDAGRKYEKAKENIRCVISYIKNTEGKYDYIFLLGI